MPKIKTDRGAAKRFKRTASGGYKRKKAGLRHILTKKSTTRKRRLRHDVNASPAATKMIKSLLHA